MGNWVLNKSNHIWLAVFIFAIAIYPYIFYIYAFYPIRLLGFNLYFLMISIFIYAFFLKILAFRELEKATTIIIAVIIVFGMIMLMRHIVYGEPIGSSMSFRIGLTPIIFLTVAIIAIKHDERSMLQKIIINNALIQAVIGILHQNYFGNFTINPQFLSNGQTVAFIDETFVTRESGILVSASLYAHMILLGMFLIVFKKERDFNINSRISEILVVFVMLYAIFLSQSRYPVVVSCLLSILYLLKYIKIEGFKPKYYVFISFFLTIFVLFSFPEIDQVVFRLFDEGMGARWDKNILAIETIVGTGQNFMIGAKRSVLASLVTEQGIQFSDNSFLETGLLLGGGYLFIIISAYIYMLYKYCVVNLTVIIMVAYIAGTLFLANSIYWDIYMLYFSVILCVLCVKNDLKNTL